MLKTYCEINFFTANFRESQCTVQPAKSDSDAMSSLQNYQGLSILSVLKIGFHGDTFVVREHNTNGMFHFSLKF